MLIRDRNALMALGTLFAGLGATAGIVLVARGRAQDVYPWAAAVTLTGAVVGSLYALGGDEPPRLVRK